MVTVNALSLERRWSVLYDSKKKIWNENVIELGVNYRYNRNYRYRY